MQQEQTETEKEREVEKGEGEGGEEEHLFVPDIGKKFKVMKET